jgi:hypothetical protein
MDVGMQVRGGGMALTLSPTKRGAGGGDESGGAHPFKSDSSGGDAGSAARGASPTTVLWRAFDGVAAAGASPRTLSEDGGDGGSSAASPDASTSSAAANAAAGGLAEQMTHVSELVRPRARALLLASSAAAPVRARAWQRGAACDRSARVARARA